MKKIATILLTAATVFVNCNLYGQGTSSAPKTQSGPSQITRPPLRPAPSKPGDKKSETQFPDGPTKAPQYAYRPTFIQPGILTLRGGGFVGVDHLFNVSRNIPVVVELEKSDSVILELTKEKIQAIVEKAFQAQGISTTVLPSEGPALPFFHVLIMVIPAGDGISAFCAGRLFEKVELDRVRLPLGVYFQGITWEYQNLIFTSKGESEGEIETAVNEVVQQFLKRYQYYKNLTPGNPQ